MSNKTKNIQKIKVGRYEPNLATVHEKSLEGTSRTKYTAYVRSTSMTLKEGKRVSTYTLKMNLLLLMLSDGCSKKH